LAVSIPRTGWGWFGRILVLDSLNKI